MDDRIGTILDGKYRLVRLLGQGGMGAVFEAEHILITRRVAVKLLHPSLSHPPATSASNDGRFLREAQAASSIGHPNIIDIQDIGRTPEGILYMVMEFLDGESLGARIRRRGRLAVPETLAILRQVLLGLAAAHDKGIIHRDLKPDNIFLTPDSNGLQRVKILDFGISKVLHARGDAPTLTSTGTVMGTPLYMSPEQARGAADIDLRTDLWSVGVILYQLLSGRLPYPGDSYNQVLAAILTASVAPLPLELCGGSQDLCDLVSSAMARDPEQRPQSARDFALRLTASALPQDAPSPDLDTLGETLVADSASATLPPQTIPATRVWPKYLLWYLLTLPFAWSLLLVFLLAPSDVSQGVFSSFSLPTHSPTWVAGLVVGLLAACLTWASVATARFWSGGGRIAWLHGSGFALFPALTLLATWRCHQVLVSRVEGAMASMRSYGAVTRSGYRGLESMLNEAVSLHLNTSAGSLFTLGALAVIVLMGYAFAPLPPGQSNRRLFLTHLLLPVALTTAGIGAMQGFGGLDGAGLWAYPPLYLWALTWYATFRTLAVHGRNGPALLEVMRAGIIAMAAMVVLAIALGHIALFSYSSELSREEAFPAILEGLKLVDRFFFACAGLLFALDGVLLLALYRKGGLGAILRALNGRRLAAFAAIPAMVVMPFIFLQSGGYQMQEALRIPLYQPGLLEMVPAPLMGEADPTFYLDREPASITLHGADFYAALAGEARAYSPEALLSALASNRTCQVPPEGTTTCITAIEAKLYCESRGKRLPTPDEWRGAILAEDNLAIRPPEQGEWTMAMKHGTPTFTVMGLPQNHPATSANPQDARQDIAFRCAFTF